MVDHTRAESGEPAAPPRWARAVDLACLALVVLAGVVALGDGFRFRAGVVRLSVTSAVRVLLVALGLAVVRHVASRAVPIWRDLPRRIVAWRDSLVDDVAVGPGGGTPPGFVFELTVLFTALTVLMTWPQAWRLRDGLSDPGDPLLNTWALRWIAHQLVTDPRHLFDGNIFAPEKNTLAYSETLLAPGILTAPLAWLGVGAIAVHNLVFLAGYVASGVGAALLVRDLTGNAGASIVAGVVFAFFPFRFDHAAQLQLQQAQWIPLALWSFHRVLRAGRLADGAWLGLFVALQLLSCMYYGIFLSAYLLVLGAVLLLWRPSELPKRVPALVVGVVVALVLFAPAAVAYLRAHAVVGERSVTENIQLSGRWANFLAAPDVNRLYGWTAARFGGGVERQLFPGVAAVLLAIVGLVRPWSAVRLAYGVALVFAVDLTLGFNGFLYPLLYQHAGIFRALRIPALAIVMVGMSLAVLAGYGVARLSTWFASSRARQGVVVAAAVLVLVESLSIPTKLTTLPTRMPPIYADLLRDIAASGTPAPATIIEVPVIPGSDGRFQDQIYMYYSTFHWQALANGYSGFFPPAYMQIAGYMQRFPDGLALGELRERNVRYVVIHGERMDFEDYEELTQDIDECRRCGITLVARQSWEDSGMSLYRIEY